MELEMAIKRLLKQQLYAKTDVEYMEYTSTKFIPANDEIIIQERAKKAVEFAMSMPSKGYNIYAIGQNGLGKRTMILRYLHTYRQTLLNTNENYIHQVFDWCYVANFANIRIPQVLQLPAGMGMQLKTDLEKLITKLLSALPLAFDNDLYYNRADKLRNQLNHKQQVEFDRISKEAKSKNISLTLTSQGDYQFVALNGDEAHTEESFAALSKRKQEKFNRIIDELEIKLRNMGRSITEFEDAYSDRLKKLNDEVTLEVIGHFITQLKIDYTKYPEVKNYLTSLQKDIVENVDLFLEQNDEQTEMAMASMDKKLPRRYKINVLVTQENNNLPIIVEENPNYHNLFGLIETATFKGTVFTDFSLIRAGSLHKANGGVLLLDAQKIVEQPYVWEGLKRALRSKQLSFTSLEKEITLTGAVSLDPEAIPLNVKIILFGDHGTYQALQRYDPEFDELFKVTADFKNSMDRTPKSELAYANFISSVLHDNNMLHCDKKALAKMIEHSSRLAGDQRKLSLYSADSVNLLREANYVALQANANMIRSKHIKEALANQEQRVNRLQSEIMEGFVNGTTLLNTSGSAIGQVNALAVFTTSNHKFGIPNRITAVNYYGSGEIIDIERSVDFGGSIHSKGMMILSAYLSSIFGKTASIPLTTTITFEQSYGEVDGDSASMAECCAIVSAFSKLANRQDVAITGSMNQFGQAQPIGGINEKIEGFFDVCTLQGRDHNQGVIIPSANVYNLMLRSDILVAVENETFHIWAVDHVTDAIEILTGIKSGELLDNGNYPVDTVFGIAQTKLNSLRK